jgi:hypothetical protein
MRFVFGLKRRLRRVLGGNDQGGFLAEDKWRRRMEKGRKGGSERKMIESRIKRLKVNGHQMRLSSVA